MSIVNISESQDCKRNVYSILQALLYTRVYVIHQIHDPSPNYPAVDRY